MKYKRNDTDLILRAAVHFSSEEEGAIEIGKGLMDVGADDLVDGGFWILGLNNSKEEFYSDNYIKSMGYTSKNFPLPPDSWMEVITSNDLIKLRSSFKKYIDSLESEPFREIATYNTRKGGLVSFVCTGLLVLVNGVAEYMVGSHKLIK